MKRFISVQKSEVEMTVHWIENDDVTVGVVSSTLMLDENFEVIEGDVLEYLELNGFELEQDWENEETYIEFREENGETGRLVFNNSGVRYE